MTNTDFARSMPPPRDTWEFEEKTLGLLKRRQMTLDAHCMGATMTNANARFESGDVTVSLEALEGDYRFTIAIKDRSVLVCYQYEGPNQYRFTSFEGNPVVVHRLSERKLGIVGRGVLHCILEVQQAGLSPAN